MVQYTASLDVESALAAPRTCPTCGSYELSPAIEQGGVTIACRSCLRCWSYEMGTMVPTPRQACSACAEGPTRLASTGQPKEQAGSCESG